MVITGTCDLYVNKLVTHLHIDLGSLNFLNAAQSDYHEVSLSSAPKIISVKNNINIFISIALNMEPK